MAASLRSRGRREGFSRVPRAPGRRVFLYPSGAGRSDSVHIPQAPGARSARLATRLSARRRGRAGRAAARLGPAHLPHLGARRRAGAVAPAGPLRGPVPLISHIAWWPGVLYSYPSGAGRPGAPAAGARDRPLPVPGARPIKAAGAGRRGRPWVRSAISGRGRSSTAEAIPRSRSISCWRAARKGGRRFPPAPRPAPTRRSSGATGARVSAARACARPCAPSRRKSFRR